MKISRIATNFALVDLLLVFNAAKKSLPASSNNLVVTRWAWFKRNVGVVKNFAHAYIHGPLNLQSVPTPMVYVSPSVGTSYRYNH